MFQDWIDITMFGSRRVSLDAMADKDGFPHGSPSDRLCKYSGAGRVDRVVEGDEPARKWPGPGDERHTAFFPYQNGAAFPSAAGLFRYVVPSLSNPTLNHPGYLDRFDLYLGCVQSPQQKTEVIDYRSIVDNGYPVGVHIEWGFQQEDEFRPGEHRLKGYWWSKVRSLRSVLEFRSLDFYQFVRYDLANVAEWSQLPSGGARGFFGIFGEHVGFEFTLPQSLPGELLANADGVSGLRTYRIPGLPSEVLSPGDVVTEWEDGRPVREFLSATVWEGDVAHEPVYGQDQNNLTRLVLSVETLSPAIGSWSQTWTWRCEFGVQVQEISRNRILFNRENALLFPTTVAGQNSNVRRLPYAQGKWRVTKSIDLGPV